MMKNQILNIKRTNVLYHLKISIITLILIFGVLTPTASADSETLPIFPCECSGSVTIGNIPAPSGTIIRAFIGDTEAGRITVTSAGVYGGDGLFDDRLLVEGDGDTASQEITFKIWSNDVSETLTFQPWDSRTFDLHIAELEGDFNANAFVDIGDVSKVAYMIAEKTEPEISADFNGNGEVDIGDASKIAYFLVREVEFL